MPLDDISGDASRVQAHARPVVKRRFRKRTILSAILLLSLVFAMVAFQADFIPSESMEPNLMPGDHILTMRAWLAYPGHGIPARGDIIVFHVPDAVLNAADRGASRRQIRENVAASTTVSSPGKSDILIKRVVGLPGDRVRVELDRVLINGAPMPQPYSVIQSDEDTEDECAYGCAQDLVVPEGQVFVLGDNRNNSEDGRFWGTLKKERIIGKFIRKLYTEGSGGLNALRKH